MMNETLKEIAKCRRCGRGFITLGRWGDFIDHYLPAKFSGVEPNSDGECGGAIEVLASQDAEAA